MKRAKRLLAFMLVLALGACEVQGWNVNAAKAKKEKYSLNKTSAKLVVGETMQLKVKKVSSNVKVKWSSNKKSIVTVTKKGKIKAKKAGKARITAQVRKKKLYCKVTVINKRNERTTGISDITTGVAVTATTQQVITNTTQMVVPTTTQAQSTTEVVTTEELLRQQRVLSGMLKNYNKDHVLKLCDKEKEYPLTITERNGQYYYETTIPTGDDHNMYCFYYEDDKIPEGKFVCGSSMYNSLNEYCNLSFYMDEGIGSYDDLSYNVDASMAIVKISYIDKEENEIPDQPLNICYGTEKKEYTTDQNGCIEFATAFNEYTGYVIESDESGVATRTTVNLTESRDYSFTHQYDGYTMSGKVIDKNGNPYDGCELVCDLVEKSILQVVQTKSTCVTKSNGKYFLFLGNSEKEVGISTQYIMGKIEDEDYLEKVIANKDYRGKNIVADFVKIEGIAQSQGQKWFYDCGKVNFSESALQNGSLYCKYSTDIMKDGTFRAYLPLNDYYVYGCGTYYTNSKNTIEMYPYASLQYLGKYNQDEQKNPKLTYDIDMTIGLIKYVSKSGKEIALTKYVPEEYNTIEFNGIELYYTDASGINSQYVEASNYYGESMWHAGKIACRINYTYKYEQDSEVYEDYCTQVIDKKNKNSTLKFNLKDFYFMAIKIKNLKYQQTVRVYEEKDGALGACISSNINPGIDTTYYFLVKPNKKYYITDSEDNILKEITVDNDDVSVQLNMNDYSSATAND